MSGAITATFSTTFRDSASLSLELICSNLSHRALRVYALLSAMEQNQSSPVCARQATLAEKLKVSVGTIGRALKELVQKGALAVTNTKECGRYNVYHRQAVASVHLPSTAPVNTAISACGSNHDMRGAGQAIPLANGEMCNAFPPELTVQIKHARATCKSPSDKAKAILDVIAQFLPASIIDDDSDHLRFMVPARPTMLPPVMPRTQTPSVPPISSTTSAQTTAQEASAPRAAALKATIPAAAAMQATTIPVAAAQPIPKTPVTPATQASAVTSATSVTSNPAPYPASYTALNREAVIAKIQMLQSKYEQCMETEAEGFIMEAYEIRSQMCALQNKLAAR
jgi:hypothetical protein